MSVLKFQKYLENPYDLHPKKTLRFNLCKGDLMEDLETLSVYDAKIEDYMRLTSAPPSKSLIAFIKAIPKGGHVLDLGCGPGLAAAEMARQHLKVDATDGSSKMVEAASRQPGVSARQATFDELPECATYDGIYANFSLLHAKRNDFIRHIAACHLALNSRGVFHLGMKLGEGETRDHLGRFYTYYSTDELVQNLKDAGFELCYQHEGKELGLAGNIEPFIMLTALA